VDIKVILLAGLLLLLLLEAAILAASETESNDVRRGSLLVVELRTIDSCTKQACMNVYDRWYSCSVGPSAYGVCK
jgi:hypothetical protein